MKLTKQNSRFPIGGGYGIMVVLTTLTGYLWDILLAVSFILAGRWMADPWKKQPAYATPAQRPDPQAQMAYYDQLYRSGQITEQGYLNIRRQITGQ